MTWGNNITELLVYSFHTSHSFPVCWEINAWKNRRFCYYMFSKCFTKTQRSPRPIASWVKQLWEWLGYTYSHLNNWNGIRLIRINILGVKHERISIIRMFGRKVHQVTGELLDRTRGNWSVLYWTYLMKWGKKFCQPVVACFKLRCSSKVDTVDGSHLIVDSFLHSCSPSKFRCSVHPRSPYGSSSARHSILRAISCRRSHGSRTCPHERCLYLAERSSRPSRFESTPTTKSSLSYSLAYDS